MECSPAASFVLDDASMRTRNQFVSSDGHSNVRCQFLIFIRKTFYPLWTRMCVQSYTLFYSQFYIKFYHIILYRKISFIIIDRFGFGSSRKENNEFESGVIRSFCLPCIG